MHRCLIVVFTSAVAMSAMVSGFAQAETPIERGRYLATVMDCGGCHTTGAFIGQPDPARYLAGSDQGWAMPTAVYWPANITPDKDTGIGAWSKDDIVKLLRTGVDPSGREMAPLMPWRAYKALTDSDMDALAAFLQSIPAVKHAVPGPTTPRDAKGLYFALAPAPKL